MLVRPAMAGGLGGGGGGEGVLRPTHAAVDYLLIHTKFSGIFQSPYFSFLFSLTRSNCRVFSFSFY